MKKRTILFLILTLIWMGIVFCFSAETAEVSKKTSLSVMEKIIEIFNINVVNKANFEAKLRSFAHLTLFMMGGAFSCALFTVAVPRRKYFNCIIFGIVYAFLDEMHQVFVPGRAFEYKDIFIDLIGFFIGVVIIDVLIRIIRGFRKKYIR